MPFDGFIGNEAAIARLRGILERRRPAHAYLFSGPEGVGKKRAAVDFAQALGAKVTLVERLEDKHEILIAQVHEVIRELTYTSPTNRAVLFDDAHRMSEEAMNALLKTLEEPPERTLLMLVSGVADRLLGTIRSRCQTIHFAPLSDEALQRHAVQRLMLGADDAAAAATLAEGSIAALAELGPKIGELRAAAQDLQARILSGELNAVIEALGKIRDTEQARLDAKRKFRLLAHSLREVLRARTGGKTALASPDFVQKMGKLDDDEILDRIETLIDHERMIDLNANVSLTVEDALLRL
ncbi:MAG: AAA family ATPase [Planctomycetaceae bacterium]|nr:AAA family ATPase [Planctomycetaceae bacterium]